MSSIGYWSFLGDDDDDDDDDDDEHVVMAIGSKKMKESKAREKRLNALSVETWMDMKMKMKMFFCCYEGCKRFYIYLFFGNFFTNS